MIRFQQFIVVLFCQMTSSLSTAQIPNINFEHISTNEGLSQSNVLCVLQDSRGFMWFGTWDGLNKYDSYKMTVYKADPTDTNSLSNSYINNICESKNGDLWVGTNGGGLCRFNRKKENFTRLKHDPLKRGSIISNSVYAVVEDENGLVWCGTAKGLELFNPVNETFTHYKCDPANSTTVSDSFVKYIYKDKQSTIWIGTVSGGLNRYNKATNSFTRFTANKNQSTSIAGNDIYSIFEDSRNNLWIGTNGNGLDLMDRTSGSFRHFKHNPADPKSLPNNIVLAVNEDAENNLWVSTENGGVSVFNYLTGAINTFVHDDIDRGSISNNSVYVLYRDSKQNMWLGNFSGGLDIANRDKWLFNHYRHSTNTSSLIHNQVLCMMEDRHKKIWIGTDGGGADCYDPATGVFKHYKHDPANNQSIGGNNVLTICEDGKGNIWMGFWQGGITVLDPEKNTFRHFKANPRDSLSLSSDNAWKIFKDHDNNIWVGTFGGGLDRLNTDEKTFTHYQYNWADKKGIHGIHLVNIFEDSDNELWLCTEDEGLSRFNPKTGFLQQYLQKDGKAALSDNTINTVMEDSRKTLWMGTMNGLNSFDKKTGRFTVYTTADGLPGNYVFGIIEDDYQQLWISTSRGIVCLNLDKKSFKKYTVADGLQSNEFKQQAFCKSSDGLLYFGGINGFNTFSPLALARQPFDPPLVLTSFFISNRQVPVASLQANPSPLQTSITETSSVTIPYSSAVFSFEFASLNYVVAEKKLYSYTLENFDQTWSDSSTARSATYTNLDPGKYIFKVKGLNNDGSWSPVIKTIELIITPPFWLTWWFKVLVSLLVAGCAAAFYFYRLRSIKMRQKILEQQVQQQTILLKKSAEIENKARKEAEKAHYLASLSNKELVLKNRELEQFAYVASHDLQEPLRTTAGFAELLKKHYSGKLDAKADKYLLFISDATERMKILIKDLLDFSRLGSSLELKKVDCNQIVTEMLTDINIAITEANATVLCGKLPELYGYKTELKLLFQNLVINAIKFRRTGIPPVIRISAAKIDSNWQFAVSDNGIGIEMEHSERIFQIFQRLHTRTEYKGSGIGLSHCKKIVEIHHGRIWLQSEPGKGSTFLFILPAETKSM